MKEQSEVPFGKNIREIIFGVEDGAIGNLGVVVGMAQALSPTKLVLLAGFATMFTQAISMSAGTYLSVKSEQEYFRVRSKVRQYGKEYSTHKKPLYSAGFMALSVVVGASIPLLTFLFLDSTQGTVPVVLTTLMGLFILGAVKSHYTDKHWFRSGIEIMAIGLLAAAVGYLIGNVFA